MGLPFFPGTQASFFQSLYSSQGTEGGLAVRYESLNTSAPKVKLNCAFRRSGQHSLICLHYLLDLPGP